MASQADITASNRKKCGSMLPAWLPLLLLSPSEVLAGGLSHYVRHHQMLYYTPVSGVASDRSRRSAGSPLQLSVLVAGRQLSLRLVPDTVTLAPDVSYLGPSGAAMSADSLAPLYTGWVHGEPDSRLFGGLIDGVFDGTIVMQNDTFVVESTALHVDGGPDGHSFVYRASDMVIPPRPDGDWPCGVRDGVTPLARPHNPDETTTVRSGGEKQTTHSSDPRHSTMPFASTLKQWRGTGRSRAKRHDDDDENDEDIESENDYEEHHQHGAHSRTLCSVYIETDPVLWKHVFKRERGSLRRTEVVLQRLASSHVQGVNSVYRRAWFDGRHHHHDYQFQIQKLVVTDDNSCLPNFSGHRNRLCFKHVGSWDYLLSHSTTNFDAFCLAFAISYHDFELGTIGLAWIGAPWAGAGRGVCARQAVQGLQNPDTKVVEYKALSLNTAIITMFNYGRPVHPLASQLALAHEIGHTMGSPHDNATLGSPCVPNDAGGNFIMYFHSQDGHLPRHQKFSNCSVGNISRVLDYIMEGRYFNCFSAKGSAFCGNGMVEGGEQCDCGFTVDDCRDRCCWPRYPPRSAGPKRSRVACRFQPGATCSPSQGPCCDPVTCAIVPAETNHTCRLHSECTLSVVCDGLSVDCPQSPRLPDLTPCGDSSRLCQAGRCTGSACGSAGLLPCQLTEADMGGDRSQLCRVGCHTHSDAPCRLHTDWRLEAGDPCDGDQGVCDALLRCRPLATSGPLARLEALLMSGGSSARLTDGVAGRWWLTALLALLMTAVCALLLRCIALHIPSSNPNKPAPRSMSETLHVPMATFFGLSGGGDLEF